MLTRLISIRLGFKSLSILPETSTAITISIPFVLFITDINGSGTCQCNIKELKPIKRKTLKYGLVLPIMMYSLKTFDRTYFSVLPAGFFYRTTK
jgi:hypothetical protein